MSLLQRILNSRNAKVVGGDQSAESLAKTLKNQLRRQNKLGRASSTNGDKVHCDVLAAHWQSMNVGFPGFLKVLRTFRELRRSCCSCKDLEED